MALNPVLGVVHKWPRNFWPPSPIVKVFSTKALHKILNSLPPKAVTTFTDRHVALFIIHDRKVFFINYAIYIFGLFATFLKIRQYHWSICRLLKILRPIQNLLQPGTGSRPVGWESLVHELELWPIAEFLQFHNFHKMVFQINVNIHFWLVLCDSKHSS